MPKQILDQRKYADNLLKEIKMLNDKLNGIQFVLFPNTDYEKLIKSYLAYLDPFVYLLYESAVVQLCWLFGKDNNGNEVHLKKHLVTKV